MCPVAGSAHDHDGVDQLLRTLTGFAESGEQTPAQLVAMIDEIIPVAIWAYSADGQTVAMSQRWARITGQPPGRFRQQEWRQAMHPDDRERLAAEWSAFAESARARWTSQYRVVRVDTGEERLVTSRGVRLPPGSGMSFVGVTEDVTDRVRAEAEVRRLATEQSALQRVASLVAARPEPAAVSEAVAQEVLELFGAQGAGVVRFDHDRTAEVTGW